MTETKNNVIAKFNAYCGDRLKQIDDVVKLRGNVTPEDIARLDEINKLSQYIITLIDEE